LIIEKDALYNLEEYIIDTSKELKIINNHKSFLNPYFLRKKNKYNKMMDGLLINYDSKNTEDRINQLLRNRVHQLNSVEGIEMFISELCL